ncbi:MAG: Crp/Fnr family transcriptional regulator [Chitinophagales bacterium]
MANLKHTVETYRKSLKLVLLQIADVPEFQINEFVNLFELKKYKKKDVIIAPNNTDLKGYFIVKGLVRMYYIKGKKEITSDFREENSFFLNGYTQFTGLPNFDYFVALEKTTCLEIDWNELEKILKRYHALEHLGRLVIEMHYLESIRVSRNILYLSVDERYKVFKEERVSLFNRVSQKYIASYLGITQETLSRMRSKY